MNRSRGAWPAGATVLLILVVLFPVFFIVQMSVRTGVDAFRMPPTLVFSPTLQNYVDLIEGKDFCVVVAFHPQRHQTQIARELVEHRWRMLPQE